MVENWLFLLPVIVILMIPGPGNAMVASSAHQHGQAKTSLYIPVILLGYLYAINVWALLIHLATPIWPNFAALVHVLSAIYMGWMTFKLFKSDQLQLHNKKHPMVRPWHMFTATLKNPKAALFAAAIFPDMTWESPTNFVLVFAAFSLVTLPVFAFWMAFGQAVLSGQSKKIKTDLIYKGSALVLLLCLIPLLINVFR
ncbi:threonine transporter RhtB [Acinetobacter sp. NCu2D-2]|uniref:LysE family translocator n=1 Tax=Acinetobacter sp. NCu2D-2 TaxID=1608473 RepID=UPI0007CDBEEA|nr:LysE family transporter [Acinetobacter sp. NCu2D-2]ANF82851.1 threonine transporter RhtB [Acinetobacter sp. NCu2D-2]